MLQLGWLALSGLPPRLDAFLHVPNQAQYLKPFGQWNCICIGSVRMNIPSLPQPIAPPACYVHEARPVLRMFRLRLWLGFLSIIPVLIIRLFCPRAFY